MLRAGGVLVAIINGADHLAELWSAVGVAPRPTSFAKENAAALLAWHFTSVRRVDVDTAAVFGDRKAAARYLESLGDGTLAGALPEGPWPLVAPGAPSVFVATAPG